MHTSEVGEHLHEITRIAATQYLITEILSCLWFQGTALGKDISDVDSQHLSPQITIVSCSIAPTPYMVEVTG